MSDHQCFTVFEVVVDWHELIVLWHNVQPSVACVELSVQVPVADIPLLISTTLGFYLVALLRLGKILFMAG